MWLLGAPVERSRPTRNYAPLRRKRTRGSGASRFVRPTQPVWDLGMVPGIVPDL